MALGGCADPEPEGGGLSDGCRERFAGIEREELNFTPHSVRGGDQRWECGPLDVEVTGDYEVTASGVENLVSVLSLIHI